MERFFGFDLGDAESAVSVLKKKDTGAPEADADGSRHEKKEEN